ncbi:hypothetical protein AVEN_97197-1 [Araneus ventricosus]|uniref:Uncharacterized protein n=1 Tax=Araneus ventricosus TaxID=182803 RepID=A0A4Y2DD77_ARAVE|nr:hypothetical protein AVEN_97197-1 [Araneus ventricosus]
MKIIFNAKQFTQIFLLQSERSPVHTVAIRGHHLILVRLLRVGVEVDDNDEDGKTALHLAAENGHQKALLTLLEHNCDIEAKDTVGKSSYKEHGYRMLLIWLQGLPSCKHPLKELYEALTAINKRDVAEKIRRKAEERPPQRRSCRANRFCAFCTLM